MISVRRAGFAISALFIASATASIAQRDTRTHLTIKVTDSSGAPIPRADVKLMSSADDQLQTFTADSEGIADLHLEPGEYQYRVGSKAFCPKNGTVTIDAEPQQTLSARLQVNGCPGPCSTPCVAVAGVTRSHFLFRIKVTEVGGAVVSGALIEVDPSSPAPRTIKTDATGQAFIGLPSGMHWLRVSAPGFRPWHGFADAEVPESIEVITARLRIAERPLQGTR